MRTPRSAQVVLLLAACSATAAAAPSPTARARQALAARAPASAGLSLAHAGTWARPGGQQLVRFRQTHAGLPVLGRGAAVLLDARGQPTSFVTARLEERFPPSSAPLVTASQAAERAGTRAKGARFAMTDARLAWLPRVGGAPRLAWVLYRGLVPGTPFSPVVAVDATTGNVLLAYDATRFDRAATVYAENPVTTPTLSSVTLSSLAPGATKLEDARVRSLTCVDTHKLVGKWGIHMCEFLPKATADANGDFPYTFSSDTAPEDEFAEVSMYYHTVKAYSFYESLGMPELDLKPLTTVANLRFPQGWEEGFSQQMKNPTSPLEPYDNAFYSPQSPFPGLFSEVDGGLFFGQGKVADFAYDGDVVYHELGHALTDRTINFPGYWLLDAQGWSPATRAMDEALADYFSSTVTGDGQIGEYAAKNTGYSGGSKVIRDLDNDDRCPENLVGESHVDSTLFSGALWSVRSALPEADRHLFDQALVTALIGSSTGELGYEDLAELFRASVEASTLGKPVADALKLEFEKRGVLPVCQRVLEYAGKPVSSGVWQLANGFFSAGKPYVALDPTEPFAPGFFQVHLTLKPGTEQLKVRWEELPLGGSYDLGPEAEPFSPAVAVRFAKDPIVFSYDAGVASNADGVFDPDVSGGHVVTLDVPAGATDAWVMVVNRGDEMGLFYDLELLPKVASTGGTGGTGGSSGSGGFGGASAAAGVGGNPGSSGGATPFDQEIGPVGPCVCSAGTPASTRLGWLGLGVLGVALARRRRRA